MGARTGSHIGGSLERAARALGHEVAFHDATSAFDGSAALRHLSWRLRRRAPRLEQFSQQVVQETRMFGADLLIATGLAPLPARAIRELRAAGIECINYLTDDPWNPAFRAPWLLDAVAAYDRVFSPRRSNLDDLRGLGRMQVSYLPFAYDQDLFFPGTAQGGPFELLFAGGADRDRFAMIEAVLERGYRVALFGAGWNRERAFRPHARGLVDPAQLKHAVAAAAVALCIVRRANRDGHAMRTFELPAMRACMLVEDTDEHRTILGETVTYFSSTEQLIEQLDGLLADRFVRDRLAAAAYARITSGGNTYADRLASMLAALD